MTDQVESRIESQNQIGTKYEAQFRITSRADPRIPFEAKAGRAILRFELAHTECSQKVLDEAVRAHGMSLECFPKHGASWYVPGREGSSPFVNKMIFGIPQILSYSSEKFRGPPLEQR